MKRRVDEWGPPPGESAERNAQHNARLFSIPSPFLRTVQYVPPESPAGGTQRQRPKSAMASSRTDTSAPGEASSERPNQPALFPTSVAVRNFETMETRNALKQNPDGACLPPPPFLANLRAPRLTVTADLPNFPLVFGQPPSRPRGSAAAQRVFRGTVHTPIPRLPPTVRALTGSGGPA